MNSMHSCEGALLERSKEIQDCIEMQSVVVVVATTIAKLEREIAYG